MNNELTFEFLEAITKRQVNVSKWLLFYCMEKTIRYTSDREDKYIRQKLFNDYRKKIMPNFEYSSDFYILVKQWWDDEIRWYRKHRKSYDHEQLVDSMIYRTLAIFFRNHNICPFVTEGQESDNEEFHKNNQKLFKKFLNQSIKVVSHKAISQRCRSDILYKLRKAKNIDIPENVESATDDIHDTGWKAVKGLLIGGATGVVTSIFLGPIIGGWIGSMAGLSGAAATSFGLALLGGGSLASGGFGMFGGSLMLGTLFGVTGGIKAARKNATISDLDIMQAGQLPVLLAIGRSMYEIYEIGDIIEIPSLIHESISKRLAQLRSRYRKVSKQKTKEALKNIISIYERAQEILESEGWVSDEYDEYEYAA